MQYNSMKNNGRGSLLCLFLLGLVTALIIVPILFRSEAGSQKWLFERTSPHEEGFDFYDIRLDKQAAETISEFRGQAGKDASFAADMAERFVAAEKPLQTKVPTLKVEYNKDIRIPGLIAPDVEKGRAFLTAASQQKRVDILRSFIAEHSELFGVSDEQIANLVVQADYTNPDGILSFVLFEQSIHGVPVHFGEIKAGFTKQNEIIRVINTLATGLDYEALPTDFGDPLDAVKAAAGNINHELRPEDITLNKAKSNNNKAVFGDGFYPTTADKIYFPIEPGVARSAWRVTIWKDLPAYLVIIDAQTGKMLWRENMVKDQTEPATYNVWSNSTSMVKSLDSPAPLTPGPIDPSLGTQGVFAPRTSLTLIGNEAPYTFNNNGWITNGGNTTTGNNTVAALDRASPNGPDPGPTGSPNRVFNFPGVFPPDTIPMGESYPLPAGQTNTPCQAAVPPVQDTQRAAVVQMFYVVNRYHDEMYLLGFNEPARNFQTTNFTGMGTGNDAVLSEGQDCSGVNNANFSSSSADGTTGRMQMYIFDRPTPDRDGTLDADIVIHELTHGTTNRLHTAGISGTQGGQLHEGYSDWYAHVMLSESSDPINGTYTTGGYATYFWRATAPFNNLGNYYYGIRRYPKAVIAFTGGPMNRPHNPLTYADIDPAQINVTDGAFAPAFTGSATAPHDGGEIWSNMLWEVHARMIQRLGHSAGTRRVMQTVVNGEKLAPASPSMLQERNAILAAAQALPVGPDAGADIADVWAGFAVRGMGFGAQNVSGNTVVESFALPNAVVADTGFSVADPLPGGDGDGIPEPGETVQLTIPVTNQTGNTVNNVTASVNGGAPVSYGNIANAATVTRVHPYTIPAGAVCGSNHCVSIVVSSDLGSQPATNRCFTLGTPVTTPYQNFDGVTAPALPAGWTNIQVVGTLINWVTSTAVPDSAPNAVFANDPGTSNQSDLETPVIAITTPTTRLKFRINHNTEPAWDGVTLNIKIGAGAYQDILAAGGTFITGGYTGTLNSGTYPQAGRQAWTGNSNGYKDVEVTIPASANGQNVQFRWGASSDTSISGAGTYIDNISIITGFNCSFTPNVRSRADFDGDGRTDLSVFRPSNGNWYAQRSTAGFMALTWGTSGDTLVPADYDGDNKTDTAVFRPSASAGVADFYILNSNGFTFSAPEWGIPGDIPVVRDYDGDGRADVAIFRPSTQVWWILRSTGGVGSSALPGGGASDIPVAGDFDGDGRGDITIYLGSLNQWRTARSTGGITTTTFGTSGDILVPADYDGDNKDDIAVYRPSIGTWIILNSNGGSVVYYPFGNSTDIPVPGDYDGDGRDDVAVYRNGIWYAQRSTAGFMAIPFGAASDITVPSKYLP